MIKFAGTFHGKSVIGLGLSAENCKRLLEGRPIEIDVRALIGNGQVDKILILGGATERHIAEDVKKIGTIDATTKITEDPRLSEPNRYPDRQ